MKKERKFLKGILMSLMTLVTGFAALYFPFGLFKELSHRDMQIMFALELVIYIVCGLAFLYLKGRKEAEKEKEQERRFQKRAKFEQAQREYYDLAA